MDLFSTEAHCTADWCLLQTDHCSLSQNNRGTEGRRGKQRAAALPPPPTRLIELPK